MAEPTQNGPNTAGRPGLLRRLQLRMRRPGLTPNQRRRLDAFLAVVVLFFVGGWGYVVVDAFSRGEPLRVSGELATSPLSSTARPPATFVLERLVASTRTANWRGRSGAVRAIITDPDDPGLAPDSLGLDSLPTGARVEVLPVDSPGLAAGELHQPGVFNLILRFRNEVRRVADAAVLNPVPADLIRDGRLGDYLIGGWPSRAERPARLRTAEYDAPAGLIAVTPANRDLQVSEHLTLGDFLTKGQEDVWPKYVAITPELLDKVELTIQELERRGHPVEDVGVISGFRTPYYNAHGGSTSGRGSVSRHMYGDALDFYIDSDGDGRMDDLNGDGRVDVADARIIASAAEQVEQDFPEYVGGVGTYAPNPGAHAGFVHIDARGYRARW